MIKAMEEEECLWPVRFVGDLVYAKWVYHIDDELYVGLRTLL